LEGGFVDGVGLRSDGDDDVGLRKNKSATGRRALIEVWTGST
jgi:hypothetical protein